jgi:hypothetical protein
LNQELKRHVSILERSSDEHKRLVRKREKELEQVKNEFEQNVKNASSLGTKVFYIQIHFSILNNKTILI